MDLPCYEGDCADTTAVRRYSWFEGRYLISDRPVWRSGHKTSNVIALIAGQPCQIFDSEFSGVSETLQTEFVL